VQDAPDRRLVGASKGTTASRPKRLTDEDGTVFEAPGIDRLGEHGGDRLLLDPAALLTPIPRSSSLPRGTVAV
jgi:hypothetical protein